MNAGDPKDPLTPRSAAISLALFSSTDIVIGSSAPPMVSIPRNQVFRAASTSSNLDRRVRISSIGSPLRIRFKSQARFRGSHERRATEREVFLRKASSGDGHECTSLSYMRMRSILLSSVRVTWSCVATGGIEFQCANLIQSAHFRAQRVDQRDHKLIAAASRVATWTALRQAREKPN